MIEVMKFPTPHISSLLHMVDPDGVKNKVRITGLEVIKFSVGVGWGG